MMLTSLQPMAAELIIAVLAMFLLLFGAYINTKRAVSMVILLCALVLLFAAMMLGVSIPFEGTTLRVFDAFRMDAFIAISKIILLIACILCLGLAVPWIKSSVEAKAEYPVLLLFATLGLMLMLSAESLLAFYVALELASLTMYVMATYERDNLKSSEAGLKYFVLGSLASGMLLFGISLVYGFSGTIIFSDLAGLLSNPENFSYGIATGLVLILVAFCFKISAAPFHMWTPDVYEGAPTPVVAFFATAPKIAVLCLLARLLIGSFEALSFHWQQIIIAASLLSMFVGALGALTQSNLKRIIAYSSIGHVGYILLAIVAGTERSMQAMLIYLMIYMMMSVGLFACLMLLKRNGKLVENLSDLRGLSVSHRRLALAIAILMFSMAGIPPFVGFFGKMFVFAAVLEAGHVLLVVLAAIASVIACFYYIRIIKVMYFDELGEPLDDIENASLLRYILILSLLSNGLLLAPSTVIEPAQAAASVLFP